MDKSWTEKYTKLENNDGSVDIVLPNPPKKMLKTIRLQNYQIDFLASHYDSDNLSDSLRKALDELIKTVNGANRIIHKETLVIGDNK